MGLSKLVVIGAGLIGQKHARLIRSSEGCVLAAVCDVDEQRKSLAAELDVPFYLDIDEMLSREQPDGAVIATPNHIHLDAVEACSRHSIHMLIEKPIADTLESANRIIQLAQEAGVQILVGHHRRHNPLVQQARQIVQSGQLGQLVGVSTLWTLLKPDDYFTVSWRRTKPGGGPALINLIHDIDNLRFICGDIAQVQAVSCSSVRGLEVEDTLSITIVFQNGALGSMLVSDTAAAPWSYELNTGENPDYPHIAENCYHFVGTQGALAFPNMEQWSYEDETRSGWKYPLHKIQPEVVTIDPLRSQLEHFCRVIDGQESPLIDGLDASRSLEAVLAVLAAADSHMLISL